MLSHPFQWTVSVSSKSIINWSYFFLLQKANDTNMESCNILQETETICWDLAGWLFGLKEWKCILWLSIWVVSLAVFPFVNPSVITFCVTERSEQFPLSGQTLGVMLLVYLVNYWLAQLKQSPVKPYPRGKKRGVGIYV